MAFEGESFFLSPALSKGEGDEMNKKLWMSLYISDLALSYLFIKSFEIHTLCRNLQRTTSLCILNKSSVNIIRTKTKEFN